MSLSRPDCSISRRKEGNGDIGLSTSHIPIKPEIMQAYQEFLKEVKEVKKDEWRKCIGRCQFETLIDGTHQCMNCSRKLNPNASSVYSIVQENENIIDEFDLDPDFDSDIEPEKDDFDDEGEFL